MLIFLLLGFFAGLVLAGVDIALVGLNSAVLPDPPVSLGADNIRDAFGGAVDTFSRAVNIGCSYVRSIDTNNILQGVIKEP